MWSVKITLKQKSPRLHETEADPRFTTLIYEKFHLMTTEADIYQIAQDENLEEILSSDRFARYVQWAGQDHLQALKLYALNTALSESLYTPLQMLEVTLRNRIHQVLSNSYSVSWFDNQKIVIDSRQQADIRQAKKLLTRQKANPTPADIVASLTFGFWGTLLNRNYEFLWRSDLYQIALDDNGKRLLRKSLADPISRIRKLRNRIAHHEPIIHWNLPKYYEEILKVTRWLSPVSEKWTRHHSRFNDVYPSQRIFLQK